MRCASAPDRAENRNIRTVSGMRAAPAWSAEYPRSVCRWTTRRKVVAPNAEYTANVTAFAPENCRDRKTSSGTIGCDDRFSTISHPISAATPNTPSTTAAVGQCFDGPSINA